MKTMPGDSSHSGSLPANISLRAVRARYPLVHCIVNEAAAATTANILLAAGAQPSMTNNPAEIKLFVKGSDALSINLGMFNDAKFQAARRAVDCAGENGIPWVLDPTLIHRSNLRLKNCLSLIDICPPAVIRGNVAEMNTFYEERQIQPGELSSHDDTVYVVTGATDIVISSEQTLEIETGHSWMDCVTGMGCALSALIAAMLTVTQDSTVAAAETLRIYGKAGRLAAKRAQGPGTFIGYFIDCLHDDSEF